MNKQFLKAVRDQMPEPLKYVTAPFIRNKLIKNRDFIKYYSLLEEREKLSTEQINEYQLNQLRQILIYSFKNVPYYRDLFRKISFDPSDFSHFDQLKNIPLLTRKIVTKNFDKLISEANVKNGFYIGTTGGSSGLPLKFLLDYDSIYKENAFIYYYRKKLGYRFEDKLATFRQLEFGDKLWKYNPMHNEILFTPIKLSKLTIASYAKKINELGPNYLNGYLSAIWYFAKLLDEHHIDLAFKLKGIFLISENIDNNQRKFIEEFFKVKSITFYGHSERCSIAEEIYPGRYKFDPYYGYTEQVLTENNKYSIVGTGFLNNTMPFIRYQTDDVCSPDDQYFSIEGKRNSAVGLTGINDEFLSSSIFDLDKELFKNIITYQFIQQKKGKAELLLIVNKQFRSSEIDGIKNDIYADTKGVIDIDIKVVDSLILSPRGKYQMYISHLNKENLSRSTDD
jgi:phenylacetate-CoA ligase